MSAPFRCGHVAIVGRTNAGKSTLVNQLVGEKVAIVSPTPQTTRTLIIGVRNQPGAQLVVVDTPGFHKPQHEMNRRMVREALDALSGVDALVVVVDAAGSPGRGDDFVLQRAVQAGTPFIVALNKVDAVRRKEDLLPLIERFAALGAHAVVPVSALTGDGIGALADEVARLLPEGPALHPEDIASDQTERFLVSELIREQFLLATREEVPHATTVLVESMGEKERTTGPPLLVVHAKIIVEKENQKAILIGRGGAMLKRVGTAARLAIEDRLGVRCHLALVVGLHPKWREDAGVLDRMFTGNRALIAAPDDMELERP